MVLIGLASLSIPLFGMTQVALAATPPVGTLDMGALASLLDPLFDAARGYTGVLVPAGKLFLALAFVLEAFTMMLQFAVKGGATDMIAKAFRLLVVASIPLTVLSSWPTLPNILITFFCTNISTLFSGAGGDSTAQIAASITGVDAAVTGMFHGNVTAAGTGLMGKIVTILAELIAAILLFLPVLFMTIAMMFALYGPILMLWFGIIFGPILVCWLPWEPMSQLATKWLTYMITMGLAFAIGICMCSMLTNCLSQFADVLHKAGNGTDASLAMLCGMIPMLAAICFIGYMMLKVEHIAAAMVGGPAIGGGAGFFGFVSGAAMKTLGGGKKKESPPPPPPAK